MYEVHPTECTTTQPLVDPIHDYDHATGRSITGGYVYRGSAIPALRGRYFFADYVTRRVWSLALRVNGLGEASPVQQGDIVEHTTELGGAAAFGGISAFGIDASGELYMVSYTSGTILKIVGSLTLPAPPTNVRIVR